MKTLTIDRKTWVRGGQGGSACLLNAEGNMCCLGFLGKACGATDTDLACVVLPSETGVADALGSFLYPRTYWSNLANIPWPRGLWSNRDNDFSDLEHQISDVNDDDELDDAQRETRLRPLFKKIGYRLEFK